MYTVRYPTCTHTYTCTRTHTYTCNTSKVLIYSPLQYITYVRSNKYILYIMYVVLHTCKLQIVLQLQHLWYVYPVCACTVGSETNKKTLPRILHTRLCTHIIKVYRWTCMHVCITMHACIHACTHTYSTYIHKCAGNVLQVVHHDCNKSTRASRNKTHPT